MPLTAYSLSFNNTITLFKLLSSEKERTFFFLLT